MQAMTKPALRKALRQLRGALASAHRAEAAEGVAAQLAALVQNPENLWAPGVPGAPGAVVAAYWPLGDELDPRPCMGWLHERGFEVVLPIVARRDAPLVFRQWTPGMALSSGAYGTSVPPESSPLREPDVLLLPLLGFDRRGGRLGYGGGYYDRTLAQLRATRPTLAIGLAYAIQEREGLPLTQEDQPLDGVLTECEWIDCSC